MAFANFVSKLLRRKKLITNRFCEPHQMRHPSISLHRKLDEKWNIFEVNTHFIPGQQTRITQVDIRVEIKSLRNTSACKSRYIFRIFMLAFVFRLYMRSRSHKHSSLLTLKNASAINLEGSIHFVPPACGYVSQCLYGFLCLRLYLCIYLRR